MSNPNLRDIPLNNGFQDNLDLDTAIIGAGVSGLYSAYRLTSGGASPKSAAKIQIFELSDRIAGRLESVTLPKMEISAELGGMRYLDSQLIVTTLIEKVFRQELDPVEFPMGDAAHLFFYLRKQRLKADAWNSEQAKGQKLITRYQLNEQDIGLSSDQLFNKIIYDVLMADPWVLAHYQTKIQFKPPYDYEFTLSAQDWDQITPRLVYNFQGPYHGKLVNDIGFWNLIKDRASQEGYSFLDEAGGYYSNTINWNAAQAFPYMVGDFSKPDVSYKTIAGGYDLIAYALAAQYMKQPGAVIWSENQLRSIDKNPGGPRRYRLGLVSKRTGRAWNVFTDHIVLAMPRRSLELLDQNSFVFDSPIMKSNVRSVLKEPSFKLIMGFEYPWWKTDFGATAGHSVTDLPMRQCYYFGTDPHDQHSLFLATYNDMRTVTFWKALDDAHPVRYQPKDTKLLTWGAQGVDLQNKASALMVAEAMNQVRELHGPMTIPDPYVALYKDWAADPFGGGYHAWKAAYPVWTVMPFMRRPIAGEGIHICGEAYSTQQGWVEGAFCTAEKMLQEHFGLKRPDWLPADYYLGW